MRAGRSVTEMRPGLVRFLDMGLIKMGQNRILIGQIGPATLKQDTVAIIDNTANAIHRVALKRYI
jgi:hypothetical protein